MKRGEYLKKIMEAKGYNVMSLSKASGVAYTTIRSMIERNLVNASIDNVIKICKVLQISVEELENKTFEEEDVETIAAHHDGEEWTEEELNEIERFKEYVKSKRDN
ncbi:helix-turn-helix transcriptional regulator [Cytobacillus horneckiae]|uniref:helix-turn-helix domain-containing protein n=1 Tax=Cytobacillus horneckiae TaxID=549687 RepID=UPI0034CD4DB3